MALGINTSLSMLNASRGISDSQKMLNDAMKRLATGKRLNSAADNPAAFVITEKINSSIMSLSAAVTGNETVSNMIRTAESGAGQIGDLLQKARSLIVDSSNTGAMDEDALAANQAALDEVVKSIDTVAQNSQFGSKKLLDGSFTVTPMVSPDGQTANINVDSLRAESLGTDAKYTDQSGQKVAVDKFENLSDLGTAIKSGDKEALSQALAVVDKAIGQVSGARGKLGALESDFIRPMNESFQSAYQELSESASAISDSDFALEMSTVTRENIRSQVKMALMSQGKDNTQTLLQLLM